MSRLKSHSLTFTLSHSLTLSHPLILSFIHCPVLKAHDQEIDTVTWEKYLGDILEDNGKHNKNIKARVGKLNGIISSIMCILKELCLGPYYFQVAIVMREALFLSVMLLNSECWTNLTKANMQELQLMDRLLIKRIMELPKGASTAGIHLEMGLTPVEFLIKGKRLMFLHYLFTCLLYTSDAADE